LAYQDHVHRDVHLALVQGSLSESSAPLVRVHLTDTLRDLIGMVGEPKRWTLRSAMQRIAEEGSGIVVILRDAESPRELADAIAQMASVQMPSTQSGLAQAAVLPSRHRLSQPTSESSPVLRTYGIGAQILKDLGVRRMRVLSAPKQFFGLAAFDLEVESYVDSE